MLSDRGQVGVGWEQPPPLILAVHFSPYLMKMSRLREHLV